ncbi:sodium bicarbonate transporter-like protein 11 [Trichonephila clavipes]|nr:sodium bicarbonate transporter-like protein 11 [Trichonephila clavipes]
MSQKDKNIRCRPHHLTVVHNTSSQFANSFGVTLKFNAIAVPINPITHEMFNVKFTIGYNFNHNYFSHACMEEGSTPSVEFPLWIANSTINETTGEVSLTQPCKRENSLLFLLLMCGTVWLAVSLYNFNKTPYLQASKREILADYALPVAVISMSFLGSFVFRDVATDQFRYSDNHPLTRAPVEELPWTASIAALGMGFALSLLFFMDQNISAAMVNNPCNKLKKGPAYHLDLFVVGVVNGFLSLYGLPWMHGVLPHSPLHVRSLADVEERVEQGHVYEMQPIPQIITYEDVLNERSTSSQCAKCFSWQLCVSLDSLPGRTLRWSFLSSFFYYFHSVVQSIKRPCNTPFTVWPSGVVDPREYHCSMYAIGLQVLSGQENTENICRDLETSSVE